MHALSLSHPIHVLFFFVHNVIADIENVNKIYASDIVSTIMNKLKDHQCPELVLIAAFEFFSELCKGK
jgi:hypothetical protein